MDLHQTGFLGKGSDHLQLIKFWPSCAPGRGTGPGEIFGSALLQPARSDCVSSERFFHFCRATAYCFTNSLCLSNGDTMLSHFFHFLVGASVYFFSPLPLQNPRGIPQ